jgi:lysophospholipase L1-like esterase
MRSDFEEAFAQIREQVAPDHPSIGVHVWDLGNVLDWRLTIDRLHPTVEGHVALGEALVRRMWPLFGDP